MEFKFAPYRAFFRCRDGKNFHTSNRFDYSRQEIMLQNIGKLYLKPDLKKYVQRPPLQIDKLNCAKRSQRFKRRLDQITGPVILAAHSAGVLMTVHWAAKHQHNIQGALLVTPPDLNQSWPANYPSPDTLRQEGWGSSSHAVLPFYIVVGSRRTLTVADAVEDTRQKHGF